MSTLISLMHVTPELTLAAGMIVLLLLEAAFQPHGAWRAVLFPSLAVTALLSALAPIVVELVYNSTFPREVLFGGLLVQDAFSLTLRAMVLVATTLAIILGQGSPSLAASRRVEYHSLLLLLALGMCLLIGASHLLMIYVALEAVSLASYMLAGFDERSGRSAEAGLKYVLFGGVASGIMLFGFSLFYGLTGELSLAGLGHALASGGTLGSPASQLALIVASVFVLVGFGYKIAAAPFHMWCPDVYEGAPTPFVALLSVGPKAAGFAVLLRFGVMLWPSLSATVKVPSTGAMSWVLLLGLMSTATMVIGNFSAIWQNNLKRLLAYSSIAHAGYMLMGVVVGGGEGMGAVAVYLAVYVLMNIGAFAVVSAVDRVEGSEDISVFRGLGTRAPLLALCMAVFLLSLAGLPPTAGFVGKLYLFAALIKHGGFWYVALALVGILNSVVSLYFYARVLKAMYLESAPSSVRPLPLASPASLVALTLCVPTLVLGVFWQPLAQIARWSTQAF